MTVGWKSKFDQNTLERGRTSCLNMRVINLKQEGETYKAGVLGRERLNVTIKMHDGNPAHMSCSCPVIRSGRNCEHMAAVLFAIEARLIAEEQGITEKMVIDGWKENKTEPVQSIRKRRKTAEEKLALEQKKAAEEFQRKEEERVKEEQRQKELEREEKRVARRKRKEDKSRREEERKQKAEEARRKEYEKQMEEEKKREEIRRQKEIEAQRREEKRRREREAARIADEKRRIEEAGQRAKEEKVQKAEARREEKPRLEEEHAMEVNRRRQEQMMQEIREEQEIKKEQELAWVKKKEEYSVVGNTWENGLDTATAKQRIEQLGHYTYFQGSKIRSSVKMTKEVQNRGEQYCRQGKVLLKDIYTGFERNSGRIVGQVTATGLEGSREFPIEVVFSRSEIHEFRCNCRSCRRDYSYWYYSGKISCPYKAGVLLMLEEYLNTHNLGDATDQKAQILFNTFHNRHVNLVVADMKAESLRLLPRLTKNNGKLSVSFRVGENKLYIVKNLEEFCQNVKSSATATYGANTQINHSIDNFSDRGREWIRFINQIVREEQEFRQRLLDSRSYYAYKSSGIGSSLSLYGWRLDEFYHKMQSEDIEYEDKDAPGKKKGVLRAGIQNPRVTMRVESDEDEGSRKEFHGISINGTLPELYSGTDTAYFVEEGQLFRTEKMFLEKIEPLAKMASGNKFSFRVGRNHMAEFYYRILPELEDIVDIVETEPEKFRSYLPPEVHFAFYLDAEDDNMICSVFARYGEEEFSVFDTAMDGVGLEPFRDAKKENEILFLAAQCFPQIDWERKELHCGGDESQMYQILENGVERLMELGEVRCTKRFLGCHVVRRMKVSVGVSVSGGLLDLDIVTEDVPSGELLDILQSYRLKKKYYRLKNGDFVNLEEQNLQMLAELMDVMNLKPKEFIKGRMHLPMFRTLYLDRMLEENDSVYSNRDSHFREIVKGFKTVKDADFEEPESLSGIMRKYQKDGFKWLRTLETWKFGGILADDMGLGKTLQVIAVLLAAKQERQSLSHNVGKDEISTVSLVVAPASLVFNWGEEIGRFAPELSVVLVTGTQEERRSKIESWQHADVLVTSYDLLKRDIAYYEDKQFLYEIIDEAQYIKNHTTAAAKAVKVVNSQTRFALTGTPIENRLSELWSIFDYLMPGFLYGYDTFRKEIELPVVKNKDENAMKRLQKMVSPFILRRLKEEVLKDLPEKLEEIRYVGLGDKQQKLYDGQVVHMKECIASQDEAQFNKNKLQILAELTRLRQICCAPQLCFEDYHGDAAKVEACLDLVQSAIDGEHRILLFSQFTSMLELLQQRLDQEGISYCTITGRTTKESRLRLVKEFNEGNIPLFLISLKAGGVGLNLTGADVVIHYDPWWNQAVQNQATDRAHRIGQIRKVTVYKLIVKNSIEEKIQKLQEEKGSLAEQIIGGETGQLGSMSREDILALL